MRGKIFLLLCCVFSYAEMFSPQIAPKSKIRLGGEFNLGIDYYHYQEPSVMDISGPMLSFDGSFTLGYKLFKFQLDGLFSTYLGANTYEGGLYDNLTHQSTPYSTSSEDWYLGIASRFGVAVNMKDKEVVFVYAGLGYRFLHNFMIDKPNIKASYERDQGYLYFLIGIDGEVAINPFISIIATLQYRQLLYGHQTSGMRALGFDNDFNFTQNDGFGGRVSVGGKFYLNNKMALKAKLYFDYWAIEASNFVAGVAGGKFIGNFVEPRNTTKVIGVSLGLSL